MTDAGRLSSLERSGLTLGVLDDGPLDGDVVVLLHGFPERATSWRRVAPLLHEAGFRTLALDQRGYAPGARPTRRRDYRIGELVGDAVALVDLAGAPVHLVGHDWGAIVGWALAARHPELLRTFTAVSVPHPAAFLEALLRSKQVLRSWYVAAAQAPVVPEWWATRADGFFDGRLRASGMTEEEISRFRTEVVDAGALTFALNYYRALPFGDPTLLRSRVRVPTTLVWSDGDVHVDRAGIERTASHVDADYELVTLPGVSHWVPTQAPRPLAEAILSRVRAA